jgi:hypothetical protein
MTHTIGFHEIVFFVLVTILAVVLWTLVVTPVGGA